MSRFSVTLLLLAAGCGRLPGRPTEAEVPLLPVQVTNFAALYSQNCAGCHGTDGRGNGALALANPVYLAIANDEVLRRVTAQGVPGTLMPAFARSAGGLLTEAQIEILVQGMRTRWSKPEWLGGATPPPYAARGPGDARHGGDAFAVFCASCHGPTGRGTNTVDSIVDGAFLALVSDQYLRSTIIAGRPELKHPDWQHLVPSRALTDQQVTDLVAWLAAQRVATPGQPYPTVASPRISK
ncbi:MAG TPA: cytochrome c [Verrucomicrobiota bacterium]|nr:cytochrome c [Verrucomicrobiota bacterium]